MRPRRRGTGTEPARPDFALPSAQPSRFDRVLKWSILALALA
jgi:hypothetical protein